jgi:anaerobic selenocysteine-containing dehydrogenase
LINVDDDGTLGEIRGDPEDVFSAGYICPKGVAVKGLHTDPDRLRTPMLRVGGTLHEASWGEAWAVLAYRLPALIEAHGPDAVALYVGSGAAHNLDARLYAPALAAAIGTRSVFSATSLWLRPKQVAAGLLYGSTAALTVPDVDRTDYLILIGANPVTSNGGVLTAADLRSRLRALRRRGGRLVVVDPRQSSTAEGADEHLRIRPGTDAALLLGMIHVLVDEGLIDLGGLADRVDGVADVAALATDFTPARVARRTGLDPGAIRRLTRDLAAAPAAAVHAGVGALTTGRSTVVSWLVEVINVLTGNLDRPGGAMFPCPAHWTAPPAGERSPFSLADGPRTRVRGLPILEGEQPATALAEEMDTDGPGRIRALITIGGNPARSLPDSARFRSAVDGLDLMISVDTYLNETTSLADIVLPVPSILERAHYDLDRYALACRNVANYSPPVLPLPLGMQHEWETLARLGVVATGGSPSADLAGFDDEAAARLAKAIGIELPEDPEGVRGPQRMLDLLLKTGPYGLCLEDLEFSPHGLDLGELEPRLDEVLCTADRRLNLAPPVLIAEAAKVRGSLDAEGGEGLLLIGRRHLRSQNSWLHNLPAMVSGARRCTVQVHPDDAARLRLRDGGMARVSSRTGEVVAAVQVTEEVLPGVVSLPHGWGHDEPQARLRVAAGRPGVNVNRLTDTLDTDQLTGNAVFNGVPVWLAPHSGDAPATEGPVPDRRQGVDRRQTPRGPGGIGPESFGPA